MHLSDCRHEVLHKVWYFDETLLRLDIARLRDTRDVGYTPVEQHIGPRYGITYFISC